MSGHPVAISAHAGPAARAGPPSHPGPAAAHAGATGIAAYRDAAATGADYVELDIRRTADGELVAWHDARTGTGHLVCALEYPRLCELAGHEVPRVADVLAAIKGRARGHLDLKDSGAAAALVRLALAVLGPGQFVVTTADDACVAAVRSRFPDKAQVPVALALGSGPEGASPLCQLRTRLNELRPLPRLRACGADGVALRHQLARAGTARHCRRHQLTVMVWTVSREREIRYWLRQDIDILITDQPAQAIALRDRVAPPIPGFTGHLNH